MENLPPSLRMKHLWPLADRIEYSQVQSIRNPAALEIEVDYRTWQKALFPSTFTKELAAFHHEFWRWLWRIELGIKPDKAFIAIWPRGFSKSTNAETGIISLGARKARKYGWYISGTQDLANGHVSSVAEKLESPNIARYYPKLAQPKVGAHGNRRGYRVNRLWTDDDFVVDAMGLDTAARGKKVGDARPDFIVLDDIDNQADSPHVTQSKINTLLYDLLPAGSPDVAILGVQNIIHRNSVFAHLASDSAEYLANRYVSGPFPAIRNFQYVREGRRAYITSGESTWPEARPIEVLQGMIDDFTLEGFLRECQHEVDQAVKGALFPEWSETYHIITDSEFAAHWKSEGIEVERDERGRAVMPERFTIGRAQDFGTTPGHPAATAYAARPSHAHSLNDSVFIHREIVMPDWKAKPGEHEPVTVGRLAQEIHAAERRGRESNRMQMAMFSHEQTAALNTYLFDLPPHLRLTWTKWKPNRLQGIAQIQNALAIEYQTPHPFRRYPQGHPQEGEPLMGCPRFYMVVADGQGELFMNADGQMRVKPGINADGMERARFEFPIYQLHSTQDGLESEQPNKIDDDFIDALKGLAEQFFPVPGGLSKHEKIERALPETLRVEAIQAGIESGERDAQGAWAARDFAIREAEKKLNKPNTSSPWLRHMHRK